MANRADRMVDLFRTGFGAGQALGSRLDKNAERSANQEYQEAKSAIPAPYAGQTEQDKMLQEQTMGEAIPVSPGAANAQQELDTNQAFQQDASQMGTQSKGAYAETMSSYSARVRDAKNKMSKWMSPKELQEFDEGEAKSAVTKFKQGTFELAQMIEMGADAQTIADTANKSYGSIPNGTMGIASVGPDGTPIMTFMSESTGNMFGSIPLTDAKAITKMAAFIDQPDKYLEYTQDQEKLDSDVTHQRKQEGYWQDTTETNQFKAVSDALNSSDMVAAKASANAKGARYLGMKPSEFNSHVDDVRSNAEAYGQDKNLSAYDSMNITAKGIDFQAWNPQGIRTADAAADVGIQWHEQRNASINNVLNLGGGDYSPELKQEILQYEQNQVVGPQMQQLITLDMGQRGIIKDGKEAGEGVFVTGDGQEMTIPPSVFGEADPMSGVGIAATSIRNSATGVGKFQNLPQEVRDQFTRFMSDSVSKWSGGMPQKSTAKAPPQNQGIATTSATTTTGGATPVPKTAIPAVTDVVDDLTPKDTPATPAAPKDVSTKGLPKKTDYNKALFTSGTRGRGGARSAAWKKLSDYDKYAVKQLRDGSEPLSKEDWSMKAKAIANAFNRGG